MTKKELVLAMTAALTPMIGKPFTKEHMDSIIAEFGPKAGGGFAKINVDEITKVENGKTVAIFDTVAKVWLPATEEYFYEDKKNPDAKLNGLKNHSKAREKCTKEHVKYTKKAKDIVWEGSVDNDYLNKDECKKLLSAVPAINYARIIPMGQENQGTLKADPKAAEFTKMCMALEEKIAKAKGGNTPKQPAVDSTPN